MSTWPQKHYLYFLTKNNWFISGNWKNRILFILELAIAYYPSVTTWSEKNFRYMAHPIIFGCRIHTPCLVATILATSLTPYYGPERKKNKALTRVHNRRSTITEARQILKTISMGGREDRKEEDPVKISESRDFSDEMWDSSANERAKKGNKTQSDADVA